jgi:hypothetical protein
VFSLKNKRVVPEINRQLKLLEQRPEQKQELDIKQDPVARKKSFGKKSKLSKIRNIKKDGKEESES